MKYTPVIVKITKLAIVIQWQYSRLYGNKDMTCFEQCCSDAFN